MRCVVVIGLVVLGLLGFRPAESLGSVILYDGTRGDRPGDQPWLVYADNAALVPGGSAGQVVVPGVGTRLTTDRAASAGYSNVNPLTGTFKNAAFPALDRRAGFVIEFELLVHAEDHGRGDRAGFSVTVITDDRKGIELAFWEDEIWAQADSPLFTRAEGAGFATTAGMTAYALRIVGSGYRLLAGGVEILAGRLRDYSGFGVPYTVRNFLFFGDNTSSAGADVTLGTIRMAAIPEPGGLVLGATGVGLVGLGLAARRRRLPDRGSSG